MSSRQYGLFSLSTTTSTKKIDEEQFEKGFSENQIPLIHTLVYNAEELELKYLIKSDRDSVAFLSESYVRPGCLTFTIAYDSRKKPRTTHTLAYSSNKGWKNVTKPSVDLPRQFVSINSPEFSPLAEKAMTSLLDIVTNVLKKKELDWSCFMYPSPKLALNDQISRTYKPGFLVCSQEYYETLATGSSSFSVEQGSCHQETPPTPIFPMENPTKKTAILNGVIMTAPDGKEIDVQGRELSFY